MPRKQINIVIASDIKRPDKLQPWEAQLLAPIADQLLAAILNARPDEDDQEAEAPPSGPTDAESQGNG